MADVAGVLHVATVDREGGQTLLVVRRQRRREIDRAGPLGAVEAPDRLRPQRIHVDGLAAVAPARRHRHRRADVGAGELGFAGGGFRHAGDRGVGDHALHRFAARVAQLGRQQRRGAARHRHRLLFQRFAHATAPAINDRPHADPRQGTRHVLDLPLYLSRFHPVRGALRSGLVAPDALRLIIALRAAHRALLRVSTLLCTIGGAQGGGCFARTIRRS